MSILITGGTGFVGSGIARRLVGRGERVVLFDVAPRMERISDIKDRVKLVHGDLKVWPEVMNVIKENNIEGIFHLGSLLSGAAEENPWTAYQVIVSGTMHVLEGARLFGVKRVVFSSTLATYGLGTGKVIDDQTLQRPFSIYGASKLFGEHLGRFYRRKFGLDFRCVRYCGVVGPGTKTLPRYAEHLCLMIENSALGKSYECIVHEEGAIPLMYFKDAIRATEMLYYAPPNQIKTVCYNLTGVSPTPTAKQLESTVKKFIPEANITFKPIPELVAFFKEFYQSMEMVDDSCSRLEWDWQPLFIDLEKMVEDFIQEVRMNPEPYGLSAKD